MTSVTDRALIALLKRSLEYRNAGLTASDLGGEVWPERTGRIVASQGGGDYAAQMLLGRMRKAGLVRVQASSITSVWELTGAGKQRAIRAMQDAE
jgi:DNA-binding transcriptional regulator PaaX